MGYTVYYRAGTLLPLAHEDPKYVQLYFYDPVEALEYHIKRNKKLKCKMMEYLQNLLTVFYAHLG
jgi:hypothetical protein